MCQMKHFNPVFLFGLLILLSSCKDIEGLVTRNKNIICLIDYSNSIDRQTIQNYNDGISLILKNMGPNDKLNVYPIDAASSSNRIAIISENYATANKYTGTTFKLDLPDSISPPFRRAQENDFVSAKNMRKRIYGYLDRVLPLIPARLDSIKKVRSKYGQKSDIFSALYEVGFSGFDLIEKGSESDGNSLMTATVNENHIVIFSDMIQESEIIDFNRQALNKEDNNKIIEKLRTEEMLPNLEQAKITVFMNNNSNSINSRKIRKTRNFWNHYFGLKELNVRDGKAHFISSDNLDNVIRLIFD